MFDPFSLMVAGLVVRAIVKSSKDEDRESKPQSSSYAARTVPARLPQNSSHYTPSSARLSSLPQCGRVELPGQRVVEEWGTRPAPSKWPTWDEFQRAKERIQDPYHYLCHCGISGVVNSGKSSLLNSLRGLAPRDRGAAPVGASETTLEVQRYVDAASYPLALYDIPGVGTKSIPMNNYFNTQGLFALDCLVVVVKDSFQEHDAALISRCREQKIPTFIVRSHSDNHIRDVCEDNGYSTDDHEALVDARKQYIRDAKSNLLQGLEDFGLSAEKVYLINSRIMLSVVRGGKSSSNEKYGPTAIDEAELLADLREECRRPKH